MSDTLTSAAAPAPGELASRERRMLHALAFASENLLRAYDWHDRANAVLQQLGEATGMSRVYLFRNRTENGRVLATQLYEWAGPGETPQIDNPELTEVPLAEAGYTRWIELLGAGEVVAGRLREFPAEEQDFLATQNICAIAVAPIFVAKTWWGFIGFDDCATERAWTREEQEILATAARIFGAAIERTEREEREHASIEARARAAERDAAERHLSAVVQQLPVGVIVAEPDGRFVMENDEMRRIIAHGLPEAVDEYGSKFHAYHLDGRRYHAHEYPIARALQGEAITGEEMFYGPHDGERMLISVNATPIRSPEGDIVAAVATAHDVSDQRKAHLALADAEERLRIAIEGARIGTWDYFPLAGVTRRSPRAREILGLPSDAGDSFAHFDAVLHPDDRAGVHAAIQRSLDPAGDGEFRADYRILRTDGSLRMISTRGQAIFEERNGKRVATRISGILLDQTEQVRAVEALQENEAKLRAIFEGAAIGMVLADASGTIVTMNAAIHELFGYDAEELQRIGVAGVSHPDDLQVDMQLFGELLAGTRQTYRIEKRYLHKSGELRWGRLSVSRVDLPSGVHAVAMVEDITERKLAEERLRESESRFRLLAERIREVFYVTETDPPGVAYVSPGYEDVWQQSRESLYADFRSFMTPIHPEDRPRVIAAFERQRRGEETVEEYRVIGRDDSVRWVRDRAYPVQHGGGLRIVGLAEDVTYRKRAEEAVGVSQERYELIARATNDVIWDWDLRNDSVEWNEAITASLGYDRADVQPHVDWWYEHLHPEDRARVIGGIHDAIERGATFWSDEYRFRRADGSYATFFDRGYLARREDGAVFRMIGAMLDLTERKQAEAQLRARDLRYRSLVESSTQVVWTANSLGEIVDIPVWRALTGQTVAQVRGSGWLDAVHPEDRERTWNTWQRSYQTRSTYDTEYRIRMRDGSYRWFAARGIPVIDEEDGTVREWVGTCSDIDERKRAENALTFLADASATLATSLDLETTLRRIAALAVPRLADWCAVDLRHPDGGYERLAVEHRVPEKRDLAWDLWRRYERRQDRADLIRDVMQSGQPLLVEQVNQELLRASAHDEEHLRILTALELRSVIIVPLSAGTGAPIGTITFVSAESGRAFTETDLQVADDLARRASLAIENARLYRTAQEANRAKDEFLATLSHELRTPLTAILGWSKILADEPPDEELLAQGLETIHRSAVAQARLIDDVLDVSRVISGKLRLDMQPTDVTNVVNASLEAVAPAAQAKQIGLDVSHDVPGLTVSADPNRLQQIVWNLLSNAMKFTPPGGRVAVRTRVERDSAIIVVTDNGQGIPPEFVAHVFEPFRQAESSTTRVHGGLGLGLAIVRYLVESHGGSVSAYSEGQGRGAQFTIQLPLHRQSERTSGHEQNDASRTGASAPPPRRADLAGVRVLFVDDQIETREFAELALRRHGAEVTLTSSVDQALDAFRRGTFDVVVSDIAMPGRDGYELITILRNELRSRVPAVAMTAFGRPEDAERARKAGFDSFVRKPVEPKELARAVGELLGRS